MQKLSRRTMPQAAVVSAPDGGARAGPTAEAQAAHHLAQAARQAARKTGAPFKPKFFTAHEYATVGVLVDLIIPRDERSGSATDAGVPEFMDFMMIDQPTRQTAMRGGLAWLDLECQQRFDKTFLTSTPEQRTAILDEIAYGPTTDENSHGVAFFQQLPRPDRERLLDEQDGDRGSAVQGNTFVPEWTGCPDAALRKLGVTAQAE